MEEVDIFYEYLGQEIFVKLGNKSVMSWSYICQRNTDELKLIPSGNIIF